jgi:pimeloyl-ACP methyl ester carboxylesterase
MKPFAIQCLVFLGILFGSSPCSAKPHYVRQTPGVDSVIVFIHGVLGSGDTTWKNDNGMYWPSMLAQDETFKDFDIYVHDYPTSLRGTNFSIEELAENARLIFDVDGISAHKDIVFLVHSMGGLVLRQYILKYQKIAERTRLIYFYSTPSTGAELASLASLFSSNPQLFDMRPMDQFSDGYLDHLLKDWLDAELGIPSFCAYEKEATFGKLVVTLASASNLCTKRLDPIMANHLTIVKPAGPSEIPYLTFKSAVQSVPRKVSSCAPVLDNGSISTICNLTRDVAKSRTIDTISQVNNKLALILSQKEMYLFPAIEDYRRDPNESKWKRAQTEAVGVLKLVREAGDGVLQFDASLRPELGPGMSTLTEPDGVRKILARVAVGDLHSRAAILEDMLEVRNPSTDQAKQFEEKLKQLVQQLSDDLSALSQKLRLSLN